MRDALNSARQRAMRMTGLLEMSPGRVISVTEDVSPIGSVQPAGGCISHEERTSLGGYVMVGGASSLSNSLSEVEVAIMLKVTFSLEP